MLEASDTLDDCFFLIYSFFFLTLHLTDLLNLAGPHIHSIIVILQPGCYCKDIVGMRLTFKKVDFDKTDSLP